MNVMGIIMPRIIKETSKGIQNYEIVDEMLAILSDRNAIMRKKEAEQAQINVSKVLQEALMQVLGISKT